MTAVLTDLSAGHEFKPLSFSLDADRVRAYIGATGDETDVYSSLGAVPPLAIAAFALGALLQEVSLPDGSLHVSESLSFSAAVPFGAAVECRARLPQRSLRGGMVVSVLETEVSHQGQLALVARATVMSPGGTA